MNYVSLCDGIGAAHCAFRPLGWNCLAVAEIDAQCNAVIKHHFNFKNYGDITNKKVPGKIRSDKPDLIIGGTPCQSFSVAGKRQGLGDPRGRLLYRFATIIQASQPRWIVWENVLGAISSDHGDAFSKFIHYLTECGYGVAWRVLDAKFFGVPQKRRRVFVVGCFGDIARAGQVLFESVGMSRGFTSRKVTRQDHRGDVANCLRGRSQLAHRDDADNLVACTLTGSDGGASNGCVPLVAETLTKSRVRRLTPLECERLQGFPDDYTLVPYKGRPMKDSPRYTMIGNSIAVPVLKRIADAIEQTNERRQ